MSKYELLIAHICEALITVNRPVFPWNEWNLTVSATGGTDGLMHFTGASSCSFSDLSTLRASARLVEEPSLLVEFLFTGSERPLDTRCVGSAL